MTSFTWADHGPREDTLQSHLPRWGWAASIIKISCRTLPTNSGYRPIHTANATPDIDLITVAATRAIEQNTMADHIVMMNDITVTIIGRIGTTGIETGLIETIGHTAMITSTIGMMILIIVTRGADLDITPDTTVVAGIMTTSKIITRVASL